MNIRAEDYSRGKGVRCFQAIYFYSNLSRTSFFFLLIQEIVVDSFVKIFEEIIVRERELKFTYLFIVFLISFVRLCNISISKLTMAADNARSSLMKMLDVVKCCRFGA